MPQNPDVDQKKVKLKARAKDLANNDSSKDSQNTKEENINDDEEIIEPHHEIKGTKQSLTVFFDDQYPFDQVIGPFEKELEDNPNFFKNSVATFSFGERIFSSKERIRLRELCKAYGFLCQLQQEKEKDETYKSQTVLIDRTMRSGQKVEYNGNVVVLGDVQPGAEVIAAGHVMIWGNLRGTVHAGATGDEKSVVCAMRLTPVQLRIASQVAVNPYSQDKTVDLGPEVAYIKDQQILAESWDAKSFIRLGISFEE